MCKRIDIQYVCVIIVLLKSEINGVGLEGTAIKSFTEEDRIALVKHHNDYRRAEGSSNMRQMVWNTDLESMAQGWVKGCVFGHNPDISDRFGFRHIGENLFINSRTSYTTEEAVDQWFSERLDYTYANLSCSGLTCGHYTQVVWADSHELGCGVIWCPDFIGLDLIDSGILIVCNYGPGGNAGHRPPFSLDGAPCSGCPVDAQTCTDNLCAGSVQTTSSSSTSITSSSTSSPPPSTSTTDTALTSTSDTASTSTTETASTSTTETASTSTTETASTTTSTTEIVTSTTNADTTTVTPSKLTDEPTTSSKSTSSFGTTSTILLKTTTVDSMTSTVPVINSTGQVGGYDFNDQLIQTMALFAFFICSVSVCLVFNVLSYRLKKIKDDKAALLAGDLTAI